MAHTLTDQQMRHAIGAMQQHLDPGLALMSCSEVESLTRHCTRAELETMFRELEAHVRARSWHTAGERRESHCAA